MCLRGLHLFEWRIWQDYPGSSRPRRAGRASVAAYEIDADPACDASSKYCIFCYTRMPRPLLDQMYITKSDIDGDTSPGKSFFQLSMTSVFTFRVHMRDKIMKAIYTAIDDVNERGYWGKSNAQVC